MDSRNASAPRSSFFSSSVRLVRWGNLVAFSHTVFALPFALGMLVVVSRHRNIRWEELLLIVVCVVAARTAAMACNRLVDAEIDSKNPRTENREIPAGNVSRLEAAILTVGSAGVFLLGAFILGMHCLVLAPAVLAVLLGYSFLKRFSALCHFGLGIALALAPGGVWYALTATWSWQPVPLMVAVLTWVAGFDIIYSCQDIEFDKSQGLCSIPSRFGEAASMVAASFLHATTVLLLLIFGATCHLGVAYLVGVFVFSLLLVNQHVTVLRGGIGCIDRVFFTRNGMASVALFLSVLVDRFLGFP